MGINPLPLLDESDDFRFLIVQAIASRTGYYLEQVRKDLAIKIRNEIGEVLGLRNG